MEGVDDSHMQAALQQLADLGNIRRDEISTVVDTEADESQGSGQLVQKPVGQPDHSAYLNEWSTLHSTIGDLGEELGSLMGGQSHREKLSRELLQSWIGHRGQQHHQQHHCDTRHGIQHGTQQPRKGYMPMYNDASKAAPKSMPPTFYPRQPPTVKPPPAADQAPTGRHTASKGKSTPKSLSAREKTRNSKTSKATKPSQVLPKSSQPPKLLENTQCPPTLKQQPVSGRHPRPKTSNSHNQVELTGFNLPQPQTNSEAIQPVQDTEVDLLSFDSPSSGSSRGKGPINTSHSAMSDLMEIHNGDMLTNIPTSTGLQASKFAPSITHDVTKPKTQHKQLSGLMASKYATSDAGSAISSSTASAAKGQGRETMNGAKEIDYWQKALPRSVQKIVHEKCESFTSPRNVSGGLTASRWAH